jgi:hypothetical protein
MSRTKMLLKQELNSKGMSEWLFPDGFRMVVRVQPDYSEWVNSFIYHNGNLFLESYNCSIEDVLEDIESLNNRLFDNIITDELYYAAMESEVYDV